MPRNSKSCLLSLCVFRMPGIVLCRQISAQCMFVGSELKCEAIRIGRLSCQQGFFLLTIPLQGGKYGGGFSWIFTVTHSFSSRETNTEIYCFNEAKPQRQVWQGGKKLMSMTLWHWLGCTHNLLALTLKCTIV